MSILPHVSRRAVARVKNPLPVPTVCPHCGGPVQLVSNAVIYGREYGEWPYAYDCRPCDAYVGLHPHTDIPLGQLADKELRAARKDHKPAFEALWRGPASVFAGDRSRAYAWLAEKMGIPVGECHWGWFNATQCQVAGAICRSFKWEAA